MSGQERERVVLARGLVKKFGDFEAVKGVDLDVYRGECFGLLGPNGAGKTSVARMIYGFSPVTAGRLEVFGEDIMTGARGIKSRLGVIPQEDNLDPELTVMENLIVYGGYFRLKRDLAMERAGEILEFMDLRDKSGAVVEQLSGGLKRRLTIGRALINRPELLILDEPTTGLDPVARHLVWQRLRRLKEMGTTLLLTTHYLEEASQLCDRLVILHRGQIIEQGAPGELIDRHVGSEALELGVASGQLDALTEQSGELIKAKQALGDEMVLYTHRGRELEELIAARADAVGIVVSYRRLRPTNLEDVFLKLTGESLEGGREQEGQPGGDGWW
ncbi:MAG: ABC transporter ATP-binding protein [Bacillota bacterium]